MEKFYYKSSNNLDLCGILCESTNKDKIVIMCHGIRGNKDEVGAFPLLETKLLENGYSSFRFDFNGHWESYGHAEEVTITREINDLESTIKMLEERGYQGFILLGASFGAGIISLIPFSKYNIKGLILWYGGLDYEYVRYGSLFSEQNMREAEKNGYFISKIEKTGKRFKFGLELFRETYQYKPYENLRNSLLPKLFVHGDSDTVIPCELSEKVSKMCPNSTLKLIKNGEHTFMNSKETINEAIKVTINFIKNL